MDPERFIVTKWMRTREAKLAVGKQLFLDTELIFPGLHEVTLRKEKIVQKYPLAIGKSVLRMSFSDQLLCSAY